MSQSGIYSGLKQAWWLVREQRLPDIPKQVELIIADACNQSCAFCAFRLEGYSNEDFAKGVELMSYGHNNPRRWIPRERALSLIDEIKDAGVLGLQLTGGGEPTTHVSHEEIFQHALDIGLKCSLVSNGLRWSENLRTQILPKFEWVRVSIDAGKAETYASIRRTAPGNLQRVIDHVKSLTSAVLQQKRDCTVGIGFVVTPDNWREIVDGVALAKSTGAAYVRMSAFFNPDDERPFADFWKEAKELILEAQDKHQTEDFKVYDLFGDRLQDLRDGAPDFKTCSYQYATHFIGGDMKPYRCCVTSYSKHGLIANGDLSKTSFGEFWNSDARKEDMKSFRADSCARCQFAEKNRAMEYLLSENPKHKEFP